MLTKQQKKQIISELTAELTDAKSIVFSDFQGIKAGDIQNLRSDLRAQGVAHKVLKITLLKKALERAGINTADLSVNVPTAISYSKEDEVIPAQLLAKFSKEHEELKILGGVLDGDLIDVLQVEALAALPSKQELRGKVVSAIAGPLRGFVGVLQGNTRELIYALNAIADAKK